MQSFPSTEPFGNEALIGGTRLDQFLNDTVRAQVQFFREHNRLQTIATPLLLASNNRPRVEPGFLTAPTGPKPSADADSVANEKRSAVRM